jgi:plasmid stabilization system protein ParE
MTYRIIYHTEIRNDLLNISKLLTDYAGAVIAENKLAQIKAAIKSLNETPHIGSLRSEIAEGLRAIPSAGKGVITFSVDDSTKTVYLISITYAGADWMLGVSQRT